MAPTTELTTSQTIGLSAALGGILGVFGVFAIAFIILMIVAMWKIFAKAGEKGWKSLIPIYNIYIWFKIAGMKNWFWALFIIQIALRIFAAVLAGTGAIVVSSDGQSAEIANEAAVAILGFCYVASSIFTVVAYILQSAKLSKAFKRGLGTTLGLIFLPNLFQLILAFGSAKYDKKALKK